MDGTTPDANGTSASRSYLTTALGLFALTLIILAAAFILNHQLRPRVGIAPPRTGKTPSVTRGSGPTPVRPTATPITTLIPSTPASRAPTPTVPPRQQVVQAYYRYWLAYSRALYTLDASHMHNVADDGELQRVQAEVAGFRQEDRAVHVLVTHHYLLLRLTGKRAQVYDQQLDRSFLINPVTKQPHTASTAGHTEKDIYFLKKIDGVWKVTKSLRQQG